MKREREGGEGVERERERERERDEDMAAEAAGTCPAHVPRPYIRAAPTIALRTLRAPWLSTLSTHFPLSLSLFVFPLSLSLLSAPAWPQAPHRLWRLCWALAGWRARTPHPLMLLLPCHILSLFLSLSLSLSFSLALSFSLCRFICNKNGRRDALPLW